MLPLITNLSPDVLSGLADLRCEGGLA
ncbi:hypothetical protein BL107_11706 [Synechococcus sp. BL107]|nr:hypothetical protein BL107_11706 [Synechococcus sp. BL107]